MIFKKHIYKTMALVCEKKLTKMIGLN